MLDGLNQVKEEVAEQEGWSEDDIGSIDLSDPENLDIKKASLELTHRDNLVLKHDYLGDDRLPSSREKSTGYWKTVIDALKQQGIEEVILTGGEPTLRDDFTNILQYAINNIPEVTVQTNGVEPIPFNDYQCNVIVSIESIKPLNNNEFRRMTDPDQYSYDINRGVLIDEDNFVCGFCGVQKKGTQGIASHLSQAHKEHMIKGFNQKMEEEGGTQVEDYESMKNHGDFEWALFYQQSGFPIQEKEQALQRAIQTIKNLERPTVIRATILNYNDLRGIGYLADQLGADARFVPLKPVGRAEDLEDQYINPGRMREACRHVTVLDTVHETNHKIEHPIFEWYKFISSYKYSEVQSDLDWDTIKKWWKRGRASNIGINKIHIAADGEVMPSPFLRDQDLGKIHEQEWESIYKELAQFNNMLDSEENLEPANNFDVRQRSMVGDPDIYLTKSYNDHKEVN